MAVNLDIFSAINSDGSLSSKDRKRHFLVLQALVQVISQA